MKVKALADISGGSHGPRSVGEEFDVDDARGEQLILRRLVEAVVSPLAVEVVPKEPKRAPKSKE